MGNMHNLLCAYGVGRKQSKSHKQNQKPAERCIKNIKDTTSTILEHSGAPSWYWILSMEYAISILNCTAHRSLDFCTPHKAAYGFAPDVAHLMEFELWETILILDKKTHFPEYHKIFGYYVEPTPNKCDIDCSWF